MKNRNHDSYLFLFLLLVSGMGVFLIFRPFLTAIAVAAIFAVLFRGMNRSLRRRLFGNRFAASSLLCLMVAALIVAPFSIIVGFAANEVNVFYHSERSGVLITQAVSAIEGSPIMSALFPGENLAGKFRDSLDTLSSGAVGFVGAAYEGAAQFVLWLFVLFFSLFYFLADGESILGYVRRFSPFRDDQDVILFRKFASISRAMVKGSLVVGIIQGALAGAAFAVAGVTSAVIWGIVVTFASFIPGVGTALIWFPIGVFTLVTGNVWQGIFILSFGFGVIGVVDNILRPRFVGNDSEMHPLLVFFATLGGIGLFGFPGLLIGPIVVSLFFALTDIYASEFREGTEEESVES